MERLRPGVRGPAVAALVGAVCALLGSLGPWSTGLGGVVSVAGTDGGGDGLFTAAVGVIAIVIVWRSYTYGTWAPIVLLLLGVLGVIVGVADIKDVSGRGALVEVGWGLYLATIGSAVVGLAGAISTRESRNRKGALEHSAEETQTVEQLQPPPTQPPAGWYRNPQGEGQRWWDGRQWTEHTQA